MPVQPISFNDMVLTWVKSEAQRTGHNVSFMVNYFCQEAMERKKKEKPQILECPKHPGASYSSRISECPLCALDRTTTEIVARDSLIVYERKRLSDEIAIRQRDIEILAAELNALDPATADQEKRDSLSKQFDKEVATLKELKTKLQELV